MNIIIFGFNKGISKDVISKIQTVNTKVYIESNIDNINNFVLNTNFYKYDYVIGCGVYSGKDMKQIRVESKCNNQFRNNKDNFEILSIPYFFKSDDDFKLAAGIGNSWCNLISYLILRKSPKINYTFLHIPKSFNKIKASEIIDRQLKCILANP